jgi:hypothetical protein
MLYTIRRKKNMATLKLVFAIFLVVFLLFITEDVAAGFENFSWSLHPTTIACESSKDCPDIIMKPNEIVAVCLDGFCRVGPNDISIP